MKVLPAVRPLVWLWCCFSALATFSLFPGGEGGHWGWKKGWKGPAHHTKFLGIKGIFVPIPIPVKVGKVQFMKW